MPITVYYINIYQRKTHLNCRCQYLCSQHLQEENNSLQSANPQNSTPTISTWPFAGTSHIVVVVVTAWHLATEAPTPMICWHSPHLTLVMWLTTLFTTPWKYQKYLMISQPLLLVFCKKKSRVGNLQYAMDTIQYVYNTGKNVYNTYTINPTLNSHPTFLHTIHATVLSSP